MGGKQSKSEFERTSSVRQSQKKQFQIVKQKIAAVTKQVKSFKAKQSEEVCAKLETNVKDVQEILQKISMELKEKHKKVFDEFIDKCDALLKEIDELKEIQAVAEPIVPPPKPARMSLKITPIEEESNIDEEDPPNSPSPNVITNSQANIYNLDAKKRKKKRTKTRQHHRKISLEDDSFSKIHELRKEMMELRDEILVFKGERNSQIYHFLKESFQRLIAKVDTIETYDIKQLKHERRIAVEYAHDSMAALDKIASGEAPSKVKQSLFEYKIPESPTAVNDTDDGLSTEDDLDRSSSEEEAEIDEGDKNLDHFKQVLDQKLGGMSMRNAVTVSLIKKSLESRQVEADRISRTDESSCDDLDDLMQTSGGSEHNVNNKVAVTNI